MIKIAQNLVVMCNYLVYNQISSQNLGIFNIWAVNGHFSSIFCRILPKIRQMWVFDFRRKSTSYLQFSLFWAEIWYIASLLGVKKKVMREFFNFAFLPFYGAPKMQKIRFWLKMAIFGLFDPVKRRKMQKWKMQKRSKNQHENAKM